MRHAIRTRWRPSGSAQADGDEKWPRKHQTCGPGHEREGGDGRSAGIRLQFSLSSCQPAHCYGSSPPHNSSHLPRPPIAADARAPGTSVSAARNRGSSLSDPIGHSSGRDHAGQGRRSSGCPMRTTVPGCTFSHSEKPSGANTMMVEPCSNKPISSPLLNSAWHATGALPQSRT